MEFPTPDNRFPEETKPGPIASNGCMTLTCRLTLSMAAKRRQRLDGSRMTGATG